MSIYVINLYLYYLFFLGLYGVMGPSRSYLVIFGSIEIMLLAVNLKFIILSVYLDNIIGQIFSLFILLVAASEISIGLSILIIYWRIKNTLFINSLFLNKG